MIVTKMERRGRDAMHSGDDDLCTVVELWPIKQPTNQQFNQPNDHFVVTRNKLDL